MGWAGTLPGAFLIAFLIAFDIAFDIATWTLEK